MPQSPIGSDATGSKYKVCNTVIRESVYSCRIAAQSNMKNIFIFMRNSHVLTLLCNSMESLNPQGSMRERQESESTLERDDLLMDFTEPASDAEEP